MTEYKKTMTRAEMPAECEERIREMLACGEKRRHRPAGQKILRMAAAAAAAVLLLVGGTMAASGEWSDLVDLFRARNGDVYTETQIAQITELEENVGLSVESGGITVTVDSVLTGDHSVDVLLRVSAPDIRWNDEWNYGFYNFRSRLQDEKGEYLVDFADATTRYYCQYLGLDDKSGEALMLFHYEEDRGVYDLWRDGAHALVLYLDRFYAYGDSRGDEKEIVGGQWELCIPLPEISEENIIHLGETKLLVKTEEFLEGEYETVPFVETELVVEDIWITATTVCVEYAESDDRRDHFTHFFDFRVVMKDGSVMEEGGVGGGLYHDGMVTTAHAWKENIDLTAIDYIEQNGQVIWKAE